MKVKFIFSTLCVLLFSLYVQAQIIEIVGKGAFNNATNELTIDDVASIDYIVVEAVYKSADPTDGPVEFVSSSETISVDATSVEYIFTANGTTYGAQPYYFRTIMSPTNTITLNSLNNFGGIHSFVAYVYRTLPEAGYYSEMNDDHGFFYRNGEDAPGVFNIPINTAQDVRDVTVTAVISELAFDTRLCVIDVTAGDQTANLTLTEPNSGANLTLEPITLYDVAGDVDKVVVSIYSPITMGVGDSFISGNIVVDVGGMSGDPCLNSDLEVDLGDDQIVYFGYNPMASATLEASVTGGVEAYTYEWSTGATAESICVSPEESTVYSVTITDATGCAVTDEIFVEVIDVTCGSCWGQRVKVCHTSFWCSSYQYTLCVKPWLVPWLLYWGDQLGSCDLYKSAPADMEIPEFETELEIREFDRQLFEAELKFGSIEYKTNMTIYPNPVVNHANIEFVVTSDTYTSIELFDLMGKKITTVYEGNTSSNQLYNATFDASSVSKGVYLLVMRSGENTIKEKISIK